MHLKITHNIIKTNIGGIREERGRSREDFDRNYQGKDGKEENRNLYYDIYYLSKEKKKLEKSVKTGTAKFLNIFSCAYIAYFFFLYRNSFCHCLEVFCGPPGALPILSFSQ